MFTGCKEIIDSSESTGFEQYLLIKTDYDTRLTAYGIDNDTPLDIEALVSDVFSDNDVSFQYPPICGPNYAAIITDNRTPDSVVVWTHTDFYLD